jgi:hypothetical protein
VFLAKKGLNHEHNEAHSIFGKLKEGMKYKIDQLWRPAEVISNKWLIQPDHSVYAKWDILVTIVLIFSIVEAPT